MMLGEGIAQLYAFLALFCVGALVALPYIFACGFLRTKLAAAIFDALYGAGALFVMWKTNLALNNGECRFFVFLGFFGGAVLAAILCKSTLDKFSASLYNLITSQKAVKKDGKAVLQKEIRSDDDSADNSAGVSAVRSAGISGATHKPQIRRRALARNDRSRRKRRKEKARTHRVPQE